MGILEAGVSRLHYVFRLRKGLVQWPLVKPVNLPRFVSQVEISPCTRVSQPWHCGHFGLDRSRPSVSRCQQHSWPLPTGLQHFPLPTQLRQPELSPDSAKCPSGGKIAPG